MNVRLATKQDVESLQKMPPYSKSMPVLLSGGEDILLAENDGIILGAVSVSNKDISCVLGEWKGGFEQCLENQVWKLSKGWISKLYVFPEYRCQGVGTKLVEEAVRHLKKRNFTEAYAGIYVKNEFKDVSYQVFKNNGFEKIGSCICSLVKGNCRGTLLRRTISSSKEREKK